MSIAGFDPSSGAGVTADLMVFAAHGLNGTAAITAMTVQSTRGVAAVHATDPDVLQATLQYLNEDLPPAGIKIGMLASAACVRVVIEFLERLRGEPGRVPVVVLDPVLKSSSGHDLIDAEGVELLQERLLPLVDWLTPNTAELALFEGKAVDTRSAMEQAARRLRSRYPNLGVLAKGGHLDPPDDLVLLTDNTQQWLSGVRIETRATHGTGCALSSAFLSRLVTGFMPAEAAKLAKQYVTGALANAVEMGYGPCCMNHLWEIYKPED